jgi:hypothetical protein
MRAERLAREEEAEAMQASPDEMATAEGMAGEEAVRH